MAMNKLLRKYFPIVSATLLILIQGCAILPAKESHTNNYAVVDRIMIGVPGGTSSLSMLCVSTCSFPAAIVCRCGASKTDK